MKKYSKKQWFILILIIIVSFIFVSVALITILFFSGPLTDEFYSSRAHIEEFNELNKCQTDIECVVGQEDVGPDLPSPPSQCVTKTVIDRFDNWFESKNQLVISRYSCFCDINSNTCIEKMIS